MKHILLSIILLLSSFGLQAKEPFDRHSELQQMLDKRLFTNKNFEFSHFDKFFEDNDQMLWGCSFSGELAMWTGTDFVTMANVGSRIFYIHPLQKDSTQLLIGHESGLSFFNSLTREVTRQEQIKQAVYGIFEEEPGKLRVFTKQEVWTGSPENMQRLCFWNDIDISRVALLKNGNYLLMSPYQGFWIYNPVSDALTDLEMKGIDPNHEVLLEMLLIGEEIWVGTDRGVYFAPIMKGAEFTCVPEMKGLTGKYLCQMQNGELWVGTDKGLFVRSHDGWKQYKHVRYNSTGLVNDCVWSIFECHTGCRWLGLEGAVACTYGDNEYNFVDWDFGQSQQGNQVSCMLHDRKGRIWLGGANGLSMHDTNTGKTLIFDKKSRHNCIDNRIWSIYEDTKGNIWICTDESVGLYDEKDEIFRERLVTDYETGRTSKWAYRILDDGDGYYWIASGSGGFMRVKQELLLNDDPIVTAESTFSIWNRTHPLNAESALRLARTENGTIWCIAKNLGLCKLASLNQQGKIELSLRPEVGLMRNVYEIKEDSQGNLWGISQDSLFCFSPQSNKLTAYSAKELGLTESIQTITVCDSVICLLSNRAIVLFSKDKGISVPIIEQHASEFRSCDWDKKDELLWLGGVDYCMIVSLPQMLKLQNEFLRPVCITTHNLNGNNLNAQFSNGRIPEWSVPYSGYYYRLKGLTEEWLPVNLGMSIRFEALAPGEYNLQLGRRRPFEKETEILEELPIDIPFPWYRTWWFYLLVIVAIVAAGLGYLRHYSLRVQLQIAEADKQQLLEQYQSIKEATLKEAAEGVPEADLINSEKQASVLAQARQNRMEEVNRRWLEQLQKQVESHLADENFNVARLAELSGLNEKALYRRVKTLTGSNTIDYIKRLRMQHAAALLKRPEFSVNEVMYMVGFTSSSYFSKCFESTYGKTPTEYREENRTK